MLPTHGMCYNLRMAVDFNNVTPLISALPWLRDDQTRHEVILEVTERDSVIEGLPSFDAADRARILARLQLIAAERRERRE